MGGDMRTTVDLPDELLLEVQRIAREQKRTMRSMLEEALRSAIDKYQRAQAFELLDGSVGGNGLQPEFRDADWEELRAAAYGNRQ
jgi:Arc/MetJ family transcription regulator